MTCFHVWCGFDGRHCGECAPKPARVAKTLRQVMQSGDPYWPGGDVERTAWFAGYDARVSETSTSQQRDDADRANGAGQDELIAGLKRALQHPAGDHDGWTDAGMEHAFFRWPVIVNALNQALATVAAANDEGVALRAALKPFADACNIDADDSESLYDTLAAEKLTWRDLRNARAVLGDKLC